MKLLWALVLGLLSVSSAFLIEGSGYASRLRNCGLLFADNVTSSLDWSAGWSIDMWMYNEHPDVEYVYVYSLASKDASGKVVDNYAQITPSYLYFFNINSKDDPDGAPRLKSNQWSHLALTYDPANVTFVHYVDGDVTYFAGYDHPWFDDTPGDTPEVPPSLMGTMLKNVTVRLAIGNEFDRWYGGWEPSECFTGAIDNYRVYAHPLSHSEVVTARDTTNIADLPASLRDKIAFGLSFENLDVSTNVWKADIGPDLFGIGINDVIHDDGTITPASSRTVPEKAPSGARSFSRDALRVIRCIPGTGTVTFSTVVRGFNSTVTPSSVTISTGATAPTAGTVTFSSLSEDPTGTLNADERILMITYSSSAAMETVSFTDMSSLMDLFTVSISSSVVGVVASTLTVHVLPNAPLVATTSTATVQEDGRGSFVVTAVNGLSPRLTCTVTEAAVIDAENLFAGRQPVPLGGTVLGMMDATASGTVQVELPTARTGRGCRYFYRPTVDAFGVGYGEFTFTIADDFGVSTTGSLTVTVSPTKQLQMTTSD